MEAGRESVGLAIAFTAGVAVVTFALSWFYIHLGAMATGSILAVVATLALGILLWQKESNRAKIWLLYLLGGCVVCLVSALPSVRPGVESQGFFQRCGEGFKAVIDGIPFEDGMSGAIVKAFLAGERGDIPREIREAFRAAGASHLLALSGLHLSIIYLVFSKVLGILGNAPTATRTRSAAIILGAGFFTLTTGASPSLVRAFLFILLRETASILRRRTDSINIFCVSLMLQLAITPGEISSVGFQLSYLAMLGIFTVFPWLDGLWDKALAAHEPADCKSDGTGETGGVAGATSAGTGAGGWLGAAMRKIWSLSVLSVSCQAFTAPAVLLYFGTFPKYFLITNLICGPLSSLIMAISIVVIPLHAVGICPIFLLGLTDFLVRTLVWSLEVIASM